MLNWYRCAADSKKTKQKKNRHNREQRRSYFWRSTRCTCDLGCHANTQHTLWLVLVGKAQHDDGSDHECYKVFYLYLGLYLCLSQHTSLLFSQWQVKMQPPPPPPSPVLLYCMYQSKKKKKNTKPDTVFTLTASLANRFAFCLRRSDLIKPAEK